MLEGTKVTVSSEGITAEAVEALREQHGDIFGLTGVVKGPSTQFNSSFLVKLEDGRVLDLHDQWIWQGAQPPCMQP